MGEHRFFATGPLIDDAPIPLAARDVRHIRDVLRLGPGDAIVVVADGHAHDVVLTEVSQQVSGRAAARWDERPLPRVTLVQGISKGERMDQVVRQATELGVARIVPFVAERSVVRLDEQRAAARVDRWRRVAAEAAKQSRRLTVPLVTDVVTSSDLAEVLAGCTVLVCWEDAEGAQGIGAALASAGVTDDGEVAVVVGPEGGLARDEVMRLTASGARVVSLGATVLRTETAGAVAVALALYERGELGGRRA